MWHTTVPIAHRTGKLCFKTLQWLHPNSVCLPKSPDFNGCRALARSLLGSGQRYARIRDHVFLMKTMPVGLLMRFSRSASRSASLDGELAQWYSCASTACLLEERRR